MRNRRNASILLLVASNLLVAAYGCFAQTTAQNITRILRDTFAEAELSALKNGETLVRALPTDNESDVAVCGLVEMQAPGRMFLDSFHENMVRKSNSAIVEIGVFNKTPTLKDLQDLTIDDRDIEDLKQCVIGDCKLKLSAAMISRFQSEIDWDAPDYKARTAQLFKQMLVAYVRDYLARGDKALIRYQDKSTPIAIAEGYRELLGASHYDELSDLRSDSGRSPLQLVESTIVWSKIKFGLKPVININELSIFADAQNPVSLVLIISKQIYANHYFQASLGLTAYFTTVEPTSQSYLFYENRSRLDGLEGPFGKIKRGVVEDRALASLTSILNQSQVSLNARALFRSSKDDVDQMTMQTLGRWKLRRWYLLAAPLWVVIVIFFFTCLRGKRFEGKGAV